MLCLGMCYGDAWHSGSVVVSALPIHTGVIAIRTLESQGSFLTIAGPIEMLISVWTEMEMGYTCLTKETGEHPRVVREGEKRGRSLGWL